MPATVTRTVLKGYFDPGDEPTSVEFQTLIDSLASTNEANYLTGSMQITGSFDVAGAARFHNTSGIQAAKTLQAVANVAPTDISATENRDNSPDPNDYLSGAQTGDLHVPGGYWIVDVPKLGPTVYFNIIPWYNWYNDNAYIRVLFEEEIDV